MEVYSIQSNLTDNFLYAEKEDNFFNLRPQGIELWEMVRRPLHKRLSIIKSSPHDLLQSDNGHPGIKRHARYFTNSIIRRPPVNKRCDVLFIGHGRRQIGSDGLWWDIYCDPLMRNSEVDKIYIEPANNGKHRHPIRTDKISYMDIFHVLGQVNKWISPPRINKRELEKDFVGPVKNGLLNTFGVDPGVEELAWTRFQERHNKLNIFERYLRKLRPKLVVIVVSYGKEILIEACKNLGIITLELQHGVVHKNHLGYHFPNAQKKYRFPDFFLSWGPYWSNAVEFPIKRENVIEMGFPYLDWAIKKYEKLEKKPQIVIISQRGVANDLCHFAISLAELAKNQYHIVFRSHPDEVDNDLGLHSKLTRYGVRIDLGKKPLHELLAESTIQIGVSSTAIYEGIAFGLETYVLDLPGTTVMDPLMERGFAHRIRNAKEFIEKTNEKETTMNVVRDEFFIPDSLERGIGIIQEILENHRC